MFPLFLCSSFILLSCSSSLPPLWLEYFLMFYRACVLSTEDVFISLALYPSPSSRQCNPFEYQGDCWQWRDTWEHKKPPAGFKGQGGEEGSDSGKELSPYMQLNKATVRGGRALIHKHTKTAGGIHTWEWWEENILHHSLQQINLWERW